MTNEDFLAFMFHDRPEGSMPLGCSFWQHPDEVKYWISEPLVGTLHRKTGFTEKFAPDMSNYVAVSSFYPAGDKWSRTAAQFAALHCIMIDDVGIKVSGDALTLEPSVIIETSPGNLQCWYRIEPVDDADAATMLINATTRKFKHDGKGITRLGRLPVGSNTKYAPPYPQRVLAAGLARYSVGALVQGLGLAPYLTKPEQPKAAPSPGAGVIATWLHDNGYVIKEGKPGWLNLHCPFGDHDDDGRTGYKLPDARDPYGHFHCPHGKCANRGTDQLIELIANKIREAA